MSTAITFTKPMARQFEPIVKLPWDNYQGGVDIECDDKLPLINILDANQTAAFFNDFRWHNVAYRDQPEWILGIKQERFNTQFSGLIKLFKSKGGDITKAGTRTTLVNNTHPTDAQNRMFRMTAEHTPPNNVACQKINPNTGTSANASKLYPGDVVWFEARAGSTDYYWIVGNYYAQDDLTIDIRWDLIKTGIGSSGNADLDFLNEYGPEWLRGIPDITDIIQTPSNHASQRFIRWKDHPLLADFKTKASNSNYEENDISQPGILRRSSGNMQEICQLFRTREANGLHKLWVTVYYRYKTVSNNPSSKSLYSNPVSPAFDRMRIGKRSGSNVTPVIFDHGTDKDLNASWVYETGIQLKGHAGGATQALKDGDGTHFIIIVNGEYNFFTENELFDNKSAGRDWNRFSLVNWYDSSNKAKNLKSHPQLQVRAYTSAGKNYLGLQASPVLHDDYGHKHQIHVFQASKGLSNIEKLLRPKKFEGLWLKRVNQVRNSLNTIRYLDHTLNRAEVTGVNEEYFELRGYAILDSTEGYGDIDSYVYIDPEIPEIEDKLRTGNQL